MPIEATRIEIFGIKTGYLQTNFEPLRKLAWRYVWDSGQGKGIWFFPISAKKEVEAILGDAIVIEGEELNQKSVYPNVIEKGKGFFSILGKSMDWDSDIETKRPIDCFVIEGTVGDKKVAKKTISFERVRTIWKVINEGFKIGDSRSSKWVAEKFCDEVGVTRFNREKSGTFDRDKIWAVRDDWFKIYYALKVLDTYGVVKYRGSRFVTKLRDRFDIPTDLKTVNYDSEAFETDVDN